MNIKDYDFLDFGASKGGSIDFAKARLGGKRGLGIDINPERVKKMQKAGYDAMVGDFVDLTLPPKCVRFVLMSHILEHVPDLKIVERTIDTARTAATDYLVITGPYFDEDKYLESLGFKFHWSDYRGHTCHLTTSQLMKILKKLELDDYELYLRGPIADSSNRHILPLSTPVDSLHYDPKVHPPKPTVKFGRPIWTDFVCYIRLRDIPNWHELTRGYKEATLYVKKQGDRVVKPGRLSHYWHKAKRLTKR